MAGVTGTLAVRLAARFTAASVGGAAPQVNYDVARELVFEPGTADLNDADVLYRATRQLAASANENLDLAGVLTNAFGAVVNAAEIVALLIEADAANVNNVAFGPAAVSGFVGPFNAAADRLTVRPGDFHLLTCRTGWTVGAGATDIINVANSGAGSVVNYTLTLIGRTIAA